MDERSLNRIVENVGKASGEIMSISYLKWAGGKFSVANMLLDMLTKTGRLSRDYWLVKPDQQYHEWFSGAFSMYFVLRQQGFIHRDSVANLNDFSEALINSAQVISSVSPKIIYEQLEDLRLGYIKSLDGKPIPKGLPDEVNYKRYFYVHRAEFNQINQILIKGGKLSKKERLRLCCLMIFLNSTCFNGMYRVNKSGEYNVPEGNYPDLESLRTLEQITNCAKLFNNSELISGDWKDALPLVDKGDLVYIDPPYAKLSKDKKGFTTYSTKEFTEEQQQELAIRSCQLVRSKGCRIIASNHRTKWVQNIYRSAAEEAEVKIVFRHIMEISANSDGGGRKKAPELLMFIYQIIVESSKLQSFQYLSEDDMTVSYHHMVDMSELNSAAEAYSLEASIFLVVAGLVCCLFGHRMLAWIVGHIGVAVHHFLLFPLWSLLQ